MQIRHSFFCSLLLFLSLSLTAVAAQEVPSSPAPTGATVIGTVLDPNNGTVPGATVIAQRGSVTEQKVVADDNGFFRLEHLSAGVKYRVIIGAQGFVTWESPELTLKPGQSLEVTDIHLTVKTIESSVTVSLSTEEIATEQLKIEEQQRVLGFIPNFYVVYDKHPAPLTTKLKYQLAVRTMIDPVTFVGAAFVAGIDQAADTPDYPQGAKGYFERFGANYANGLTDIMFGGAILPSLFHQDPRYYYMGPGEPVKKRLEHALMNPILCKGDNGNTQINYSGLGGT